MLEVTIAPDLASRGVDVTLGGLTARVDMKEVGDELGAALAAAATAASQRPATDVPAIAQTRRAYKACGKDPSRYRPASEALWRRAAKGEPMPRVNVVVDVDNLISLRTGVPCGVYDRARLAPPLHLRRGRAGEAYVGIGRGALNIEHLPVLADADGAFGSPTSDSTRARVDETTRAILFVAYGLGCAVDDALALAIEALKRYAGARDIEARKFAS